MSVMTSKDMYGEPTAANGIDGGNLGVKIGSSREILLNQPLPCEFGADLGHQPDTPFRISELRLTLSF
jgi:hypothetical protein